MVRLRVIHTLEESVRVERAGVTLLEYHYRPQVDPRESPKPFVHPLATPRGDILTMDRPHDHVWHRGLYFGWASVNGANFWGGPSYVRGQGYVQREDNGSMRHEAWEALELRPEGAYFQERLTWHDVRGEPWIQERRTLLVHDPADEDELRVTITAELAPVPGQGPFRFSSPMIEGRPDPSGYSGLTLRLPRAMTGGRASNSAGTEGPQVMGERASWLHYAGKLDGSATLCGAAIFDHPDNPRHPTHFFVRTTPFGVINPAFCWDEPYELREGEPLRLVYGVWVHAGEARPDRVQTAYARWAGR